MIRRASSLVLAMVLAAVALTAVNWPLRPWQDETLVGPTPSTSEKLLLLGGIVLAIMLTAPVVWLVRYAFRERK